MPIGPPLARYSPSGPVLVVYICLAVRCTGAAKRDTAHIGASTQACTIIRTRRLEYFTGLWGSGLPPRRRSREAQYRFMIGNINTYWLSGPTRATFATSRHQKVPLAIFDQSQETAAGSGVGMFRDKLLEDRRSTKKPNDFSGRLASQCRLFGPRSSQALPRRIFSPHTRALIRQAARLTNNTGRLPKTQRKRQTKPQTQRLFRFISTLVVTPQTLRLSLRHRHYCGLAYSAGYYGGGPRLSRIWQSYAVSQWWGDCRLCR
jgi:hypothetical protein